MIRNILYFFNGVVGTINGVLSAIILGTYFQSEMKSLCGDWLPVLFLMGTINSFYAPAKILWLSAWNCKYKKTNKNQVENIGFFSYHLFIFVFYMYYWIDSPKNISCQELLSLWRIRATMGMHIVFYFINLCINFIDLVKNDKLIVKKEENN